MGLDNVLGVAGAARDHYFVLVWTCFINNFNGNCCYTYFWMDKKIQMDWMDWFIRYIICSY